MFLLCVPQGGAVTEPARVDALVRWLDLCGAQRNGLTVGVTDGLRGIVASTSLSTSPGMELLRVPVALGLSDEVESTPFGEAVPSAEWMRLQPDALLAIRLLHEQSLGAESSWAPYVSLLPEEPPTLGRHLCDEAERAIHSPRLREQVRLSKRYAAQLHESLVALSARADGEPAYLSWPSWKRRGV